MPDDPSTRRRPGLRWLPNALTIARLLALPALARVLAKAPGRTSRRAGFLFAAIGLTDLLDGPLARGLRAETRFGRLADPLADRLLVSVGLLGLIRLRRFRAIGPTLLLARDLVSVAGFVALSRRGVAVRVDGPGKISSALAMAATALALAWRRRWIDALFWASVAASLATLGHYAATLFRGGGERALRRPLRSQSRPEPETHWRDSGGARSDEEH